MTDVPHLLSIIIPSRDRGELLRECLQSLHRAAPPGVEILVVDDGSTDGIISRIAAEFPAVRSLRLPQSVGFARAIRAGLEATTSEFVQLLNDDTVVEPGWATAALAQFADPAIAAVAPLVRDFSHPDIVDSAGDDYDPGGFASRRGHGQRWNDLPDCWKVPGPVRCVSATAGFYRRRALEQVGGLADDFEAYFEDVDLSLRLARAGYTLWYTPLSFVRHHGSASYRRLPTARLLTMQSRNEERLYWRGQAWWLRCRWFPRHVAVLAGKALRRWREGNLRPWFAGRLAAWRELIGTSHGDQ